MTMRDAIGGVAMSIPPLGPEQPERRRWRLLAIAVIGVVLALAFVGTSKVVQATELACTSSNTTNCLFGGFEIDGNTVVDNTSGSLDWQSHSVYASGAYTPFYDLYNTTSDTIMSQGSKESDQSTWTCVTSKAEGKADLGGARYSATTPTDGTPTNVGNPGVSAGEFAPLDSDKTAVNEDSDTATSTTDTDIDKAGGDIPWAGAIWFENTSTAQYLFGDFQRYAVDGDVHLDYEFNKASTNLASGCTSLPQRSQGDLLITFDTANGGATIFVSAFVFNCATTTTKGTVCPDGGSFALVADTGGNALQAGVDFAGEANSTGHTDSGVTAGAFGEAGLNLTSTVGNFTCGEFGTAYMKTRSAGTSDIANGKAEVKDWVTPVQFSPGLCPTSSVTKAQADETTQSADGSSANESGSTDMTADAALTYTQQCSGGGGSPTPPSASAGCATGASTTPLSANKGDELAYKVTYHNTGGGQAPNPVVQDRNFTGNSNFTDATYVNGSQSCPSGAVCVATNSSGYSSGNPCQSTAETTGVTTLVWCLAPVNANTIVDMYFEVDLPTTASTAGTEYFGNFATVTDTGISSDTGGSSNFVAASAGFSPSSSLAKKEADVQPSNQYCDTASGGAVTSNTVCNSLLGTALSQCVSPAVPPGCFVFSSGPISAAPGDIVEYQLTYTNNGDSPATNVVISDSIPKNSTYVTSSAGGADSPTITCLNGTTTVSCTSTTATVTSITWKYSSVAVAGSEAVTFKVTAAATFPGSTSTTCSTTFTASQIGNCASVVTDQDNASSGNVIANVAGTGALNLVKSASVSGSTITYTIKFFNTGDQAITTAQSVSDLIPTGLTFVSCSGGTNTNTGTAGSPNTCGGTTGAGGTVTWMVNNVGAGTTATNPAGTLTLVVTQ